MIALCGLSAFLAAAPRVGLVKGSDTRAPEETVALVTRQITRGLEDEGFEVHPPTATCPEGPSCLGAIAKKEGLAAALAVTIVKGRRELAVDIEAIDPRQRRLAAETFLVPFKGEPFPPQAAELFHLLKQLLTPLPEDAPRVTQLEPDPASPPQLTQAPPHRPLLKVAAVTTIATGAIGLGLLIAGAVAKGQLDADIHRSTGIVITRDQANARAALANGLGTGSATALSLCGAAGVATGLLWLVPSSSDED
jgi:hypothetical protein